MFDDDYEKLYDQLQDFKKSFIDIIKGYVDYELCESLKVGETSSNIDIVMSFIKDLNQLQKKLEDDVNYFLENKSCPDTVGGAIIGSADSCGFAGNLYDGVPSTDSRGMTKNAFMRDEFPGNVPFDNVFPKSKSRCDKSILDKSIQRHTKEEAKVGSIANSDDLVKNGYISHGIQDDVKLFTSVYPGMPE